MDDALLVLLQSPDLGQPFGQRAVEAGVLVGEARLGEDGREKGFVLGGERNAAVLVTHAEGADQLAAAAHGEERAVAEGVQTQQRRGRRGAEGRAAQPQSLVFAEGLGEGRGVRIAGGPFEEKQRAGHDPQRFFHAPHDGLDDLFARPRRREVAGDVEQGAARAIGVVVLDPLENVGDALLDGNQERGEHDPRRERDDVFSGRGHADECPVEQRVDQHERHAAEQHGARRADRLAEEDLDVPQPPFQDRVREGERDQNERHDGEAGKQRRLQAEGARQRREQQERRQSDDDAESDPAHLLLGLGVLAPAAHQLEQAREHGRNIEPRSTRTRSASQASRYAAAAGVARAPRTESSAAR